jgi:hypothetical protein
MRAVTPDSCILIIWGLNSMRIKRIFKTNKWRERNQGVYRYVKPVAFPKKTGMVPPKQDNWLHKTFSTLKQKKGKIYTWIHKVYKMQKHSHVL